MIVAMSGDGNGGTWSVYLSGEIHSDWRERIAEGVEKAGLPVKLLSPVTDHAASDDVGVDILGARVGGLLEGPQGRRRNAVRTQTLLRSADVVVVRFGDKYRQWNAAFEAGYAAALGKPLSPSTTPSSPTRSRRSTAPRWRRRRPPSRSSRSSLRGRRPESEH